MNHTKSAQCRAAPNDVKLIHKTFQVFLFSAKGKGPQQVFCRLAHDAFVH